MRAYFLVINRILIISLFVFALASCGESSPQDNSDNTTPTVSLSESQQIADKFAQNSAISYAVFQDTPLSLAFTYDTEGESFSVTTLPEYGVLTGQLEGGDLSLVYTPNTSYIGDDSIGFTVTHTDGGSATGTIDISVLAAVSPPVAIDTTLVDSQRLADQAALNYSTHFTIYKNTNVLIELPAIEPVGHVLSIVTSPSNGVMTGQLSGTEISALYVPDKGYSGNETFDFVVNHQDGGSATGQIVVTVLDVLDATLDSDNDGLSDIDEIDFYGTSPILSDTDADGFSDFKELITLGFDEEVNNFRFNPLIADLPQIKITLKSAPDIFMNYEESNGNTSTISTSRSQSSSNTVLSSNTRAVSSSFENSHKKGQTNSIGGSTKVTAGYDAGASFSVEQELNYSKTTFYETTSTWGEETSNSWTNEQSQENAQALEASQGFEQESSISKSGGGLSVNVTVRNIGNFSYQLNNLNLNASYIDVSNGDYSVPIGNLAFENINLQSFPAFSLAPGEESGLLTFSTSELTIATIQSLLKSSEGMQIRPSIFDMLDENGVSYIFNQTGVSAQDATIIIDFGAIDFANNINKLVATNANVDAPLSIKSALEDILNLTVETDDTDGFITKIENLSNNEPNGYWVLVHGAQTGNDRFITTVYTTPTDKSQIQSINSSVQNLVSHYDISQIYLHGGDILHVIYLLDEDQDGLSNRDEFMYRTQVDNPDTDGDGLNDYAEVTGWKVSYTEVTGSLIQHNVTSNPLAVDSDSDQLTDLQEANINVSDPNLKRNPNTRDTDGDGIDDLNDDLDLNIAGSPANFISNQFDQVDLAALTSKVDTPNLALSNVTFRYETRDVTEKGIAGEAGNGIDEYVVNVYRHISSDGVHPEPLSPPLDYSPQVNLGQTLTCGVGCNWELVHISDNLPGATITDITEDGIGVSQQIASGENFKYIVYLRINGQYVRSAYSSVASATTETITFHMLSGTLNSVKTIADHLTQKSDAALIKYSATHDELFYERGVDFGAYAYADAGGWIIVNGGSAPRAYGDVYNASTGALKKSNVYYDRCAVTSSPLNSFNSAFDGVRTGDCWIKIDANFPHPTYGPSDPDGLGYGYVTDAVSANDLPPYTHALGAGDDHFSLNWRLVFNGQEITPRPAFAGANTGPLREICGSMQNREDDQQLAVAKGGLDLKYLNSLYNNNDCTNISAIADNGADGGATGTATGYTLVNGAATFSVTVPAQEKCHFVRLYAYEFDHQVGAYNQVYQPSLGEVDYANTDSAFLCRNNDGLWTLSHESYNELHDKGQVITPVSSAADLNRIQYRTRTMQWRDAPEVGVRSTMQGDLTIRYDVSID